MYTVHHTDWFQSTHTDVWGIEAFHFSISNELEQMIKPPTRVPDRHDHAANTLDLFFTSNPYNYTYTVSSPLGSSDHCTVSVTSSFTPPPPIPPTQRLLWHFENAWRAVMSNFLLDFPWNDYCFQTLDPDLVATAVGEVVDLGMRAYIPYSLTLVEGVEIILSIFCTLYIPSELKGICLLILGLIIRAPLLSQIERECVNHIKLLLSSRMLLVFLLGFAVHLYLKGKLISSTFLLLKNVCSLFKKIFNICNSSFVTLHIDIHITCTTDTAQTPNHPTLLQHFYLYTRYKMRTACIVRPA